MQSGTDTSRGTILLVDDEALIRMSGAHMLVDAGYEVLEAGTADEAIAILQGAGNVNLLFSDIDMPGSMDGLDLANLVHETWPKIRLLLTSGHHMIPDAEVPEEGRFIAKPYSETEVIEEIHDLLDDR